MKIAAEEIPAVDAAALEACIITRAADLLHANNNYNISLAVVYTLITCENLSLMRSDGPSSKKSSSKKATLALTRPFLGNCCCRFMKFDACDLGEISSGGSLRSADGGRRQEMDLEALAVCNTCILAGVHPRFTYCYNRNWFFNRNF
jgi:hypothetical protein